VKFKDAELIGVPSASPSARSWPRAKWELLDRLANRTTDIPVGEAVQQMQTALSLN